MKIGDIIGLIVILSIVGAGAYFLLTRSAPSAPSGSAPPMTNAIPPGTPTAPPQPTPQAAEARRPTNEFDAGIAGINAGRDVLLAGLKGFMS